MSQFQKNLALWLVISLLMIMLFNMMTQKDTDQNQINYTEFLSAIDDGRVTSITFQGNQISGVYKDGEKFKTYAPMDEQLIPDLKEKGSSSRPNRPKTRGFGSPCWSPGGRSFC